MQDCIARVGRMIGAGADLQTVRDTLYAEGMSEYDIYLTCKGAAMLDPFVAEVLHIALQGADTIPAAR